MNETARLLDLIGVIYDAALEPRLWTDVLEKAASFVGGPAATIFWQDAIRKEGNAYYNFGTDNCFEQLYFDKYIKFDPVSSAYLLLDVGDVKSNSIMIPSAEFFET